MVICAVFDGSWQTIVSISSPLVVLTREEGRRGGDDEGHRLGHVRRTIGNGSGLPKTAHLDHDHQITDISQRQHTVLEEVERTNIKR